MSEHDDETCETCGRPKNDSRDFKTVKTERDSALTEVRELKARLLDTTIREAGFDPTLGVVKRVAADFQGDLDADAFRKFAEAEGLTAIAKPAAPPEEKPADVVAELEAQQSVGDRLRAGSHQLESVEKSLDERIAEATAAGDRQLSRLLKNEKAKALMGAA